MCGECSICLNPVRFTRKSKQLECGHLFHGACIDDWILAGGDSCPMCRSKVTKPSFKVTITIENTNANSFSEEITDEDVIQMILTRFNVQDEFLTTDFVLSADNLEELDHIISDFGFSRGVNLNTLVLNTE
jgi:hypothetical protein